jgi:glycosyltransferase involved in cell wall biosynthesis
VVLAEYGLTGAAIMPVCRELGLPLLVHFHGYDASRRSVLDQFRDAYEEMFHYASCVIAVSRVMEQRLLELGCPGEKVVYNPYGPSDDFFAIQPAVPPPRRFLAVGRFVDKKAPHCTLLAFRRVVEQFPDAVLTMGGTGPLWSACYDLVRYFGLADNVRLPGVLTPEQVREHMANACAFVQHSVTAQDGDMEGTPVAVLEAQAAALPVVATRHAGIPDVVLDGETGWLVDEHDIDGMAERMCRLLARPDESRAMGEAGRRRIREHFTMQRSIERLDRCVYSAIDGIS